MPETARSHNRDEVVELEPFKELLLRTCGHSFEKEREQTLSSALSRRMVALNIDRSEIYHSLLLRDQQELLLLTEQLTVNETYFFREPDHLKLMIDRLLPGFMPGRYSRPVRILSAGCSTGEEPYSIAILLRERYGNESERLFSVTGVDIDSSVIAGARQGVYGKGSFRGMDQTVRERYFEPVGPWKFRIRDDIRKQVGFEVVNLLGASYPHSMQLPDIILYRNVSIYFPRQVQKEIFGRLAGILTVGGCLLVGATETIHHDIGILSLEKQDSLFYYRKGPPLVFEERRTGSRHLSKSDQPCKSLQPSTPVTQRAMPVELQERRTHARINTRPLPADVQNDIREGFDKALELARYSRPDDALGILENITRHDEAFTKAHTLKASLLLSISRFDEAAGVCDFVLARDQLCLEAYLMLGMIARHKTNDEDALKRFRESIFLNASCWVAHFHTAEIMFAQKDTKRARSSYETTVRILEKGPLKELGQAYFPLAFNADQFIVISRHKLTLLTSIK
ncbi:MAG: CheR family methyltransferase [Desulfuromonadales bacterium]